MVISFKYGVKIQVAPPHCCGAFLKGLPAVFLPPSLDYGIIFSIMTLFYLSVRSNQLLLFAFSLLL